MLVVLMAVGLLVCPVMAQAHSAQMVARVQWSNAVGNVLTMRVSLLDAYRAPIPRAGVEVTIKPADGTWGPHAALPESTAGMYGNRLSFPPGEFRLQIVANLPDGRYSTSVPLERGNLDHITTLELDMLHQDVAGGQTAAPAAFGLSSDQLFWPMMIGLLVLVLSLGIWALWPRIT